LVVFSTKRETQMPAYGLSLSEPTCGFIGVCTPDSFSLSGAKHKRQPLSFPYLTDVCTPSSFSLSGTKHKL